MKHKFNTAVVTTETIQAGTEDFKTLFSVLPKWTKVNKKLILIFFC